MQKTVKDFNDNKSVHTRPMPVSARIMDINSEMGELAKEYLKATNYGTKDFEITDDFVMEYGDVLYSMLSLANELNIDANKSIEMVLEKYQNRIDNKKDMGSGK